MCGGPGTDPAWPTASPYFTADPALLALPALQPRLGVYRGLICSGDSFISRAEDVAEIRRKQPEVMAVEMESTAIAHVCAVEGIPLCSGGEGGERYARSPLRQFSPV